MSAHDTIYALASAPGKAGVAVVRVSGSKARQAGEALGIIRFPPRQVVFGMLRDPESGDVLDRALSLFFAGPGSFTGEDVLELHLHGGRAVTSGILGALAKLPGLRLAEPGEFARRAFLNGKLDLSEAEALADLIDAETAAQRRLALHGLDGGIGRECDALRAQLIDVLAMAEAAIDFSDEGDVPGQLLEQACGQAEVVARRIEGLLDDDRRAERLRDGLKVVIAGPPNAGKSTLLNTLARREVAIVSPQAGTTRDVLEVHLDLGGYPVSLADTAGIHDAQDEVERIGVARARERMQHADLVLWLTPAPGGPGAPATEVETWQVMTKADLIDSPAETSGNISISARTGEGIGVLLERLQEFARTQLTPSGDAAITRSRHREALQDALGFLRNGLAGRDIELVCEDFRLAVRALGRVSGRVDIDDVLDVIFGRFCIGK